MSQSFFRMSKLAALVATCCVPAISMATTQNVDANSAVTNHYGKTITLIDATTSKYAPKNTLEIANGDTANIPLDQWKGQTDPKNIYFTVEADGKQLCSNLAKPYKHTAGLTIVDAQGDCSTSDNPVPPPPIDNTPVIQGFQPHQVIDTNTTFNASGTVANPEGVDSPLTVTINKSDNTSWLTVTSQKDGNHYDISARGTAPAEPGLYNFTVYAENAAGGENTYKVDITVQKPDTPPVDNGEIIPRTVSAWIYDASNNNTVPGQFLSNINTWNNEAQAAGKPYNQITELHTYGSDMEMYNNDTYLESYYAAQTRYNTNSSQPINEMVGPGGSAFYMKEIGDALVSTPIIDGRTDVGYLKGFNKLSKQHVEGYADLLAQQVCSDHNIRGVQVDVEPLTFTESAAQVEFYLRLTDDFNGKNVAACHYLGAPGHDPDYVSVFTFANRIVAGATGPYASQVKELLKRPNFLVIDSLYDLTGEDGNTPVNVYQTQVQNEVDATVSAARQYHFNYKFGIPTSCSFHECNLTTGNQIGYVQAAIQSLGKGDVCNVSYNGRNLFKGIALWAFVVDDPVWNGKQYSIRPPAEAVENYMSNLDDKSVVGCNLNSTWVGK